MNHDDAKLNTGRRRATAYRRRPPRPDRGNKAVGGKKLRILALIVGLPILAHLGVVVGTHLYPPDVTPPTGQLKPAANDASPRQFGAAYVRPHGSIHEVRLQGDPVTIGYAHGRLLYQEMLRVETAVHAQFEHYVPFAPLRWIITDVARFRFRKLDHAISERRRQEFAAQALAFQPDPFDAEMSTYHRFVFLQSLYDVMLSFEHSPLLGCSSFVIGPRLSENGHLLLGRNFDMEGPAALDRDKAVFLVFANDRIPYASVSWPGFIGVATGMNARGLAIAIHGARAGEARVQGTPVAHTVRDLLGQATSADQALEMLKSHQPMVPHMLLIADAHGKALVVERVPGQPPFARHREGLTLALSNHLEGPRASDPKNQAVIANTSTMPRRKRLDELLANLQPGVTVQGAVELLRDKKSVGGGELALGHRHAIDALIATHAVVMDTTAQQLWVSEGRHLTGRFIRFDLAKLLDPRYRPSNTRSVDSIAADPIVANGQFAAWQKAGSPHPETR